MRTFAPHTLQSVFGSSASLDCLSELVSLSSPRGTLLTLQLQVFYRNGGHLEKGRATPCNAWGGQTAPLRTRTTTEFGLASTVARQPTFSHKVGGSKLHDNRIHSLRRLADGSRLSEACTVCCILVDAEAIQ